MKAVKEKVKKFRLVIILAIIIAIIGIFIFVNASNQGKYVVDVIDANDEETDGFGNNQIKIQKQIKKDNYNEPYYDDKNLTYKLDVKNMYENASPEVAIIVDTSYSMSNNITEQTVKDNAIKMVNAIYDNCQNATINLYNAKQNIYKKYTSSSRSYVVNAINNFKSGTGNNIESMISLAKGDFTESPSINKYIILFTDATDKAETALQEAEVANVKIFSILVENIVSSSYVDITTNQALHNGKIQMMYDSATPEVARKYEEFDENEIIKMINSSLINVKVTDVFTEAMTNYFDFELVSVKGIEASNSRITETGNEWSLDGNKFLEKTNNGTNDVYTWYIDTIRRGETISLEFKLNIKEDKTIAAGDTFTNLNVSKNISATYDVRTYEAESQESVSFAPTDDETKANVPIIKIFEKYSVTLKAVSEQDENLPIEGIVFNVVGRELNSSGKVVYRQKLTTNSDGEVVIDNLKTEDNLYLEIRPEVNLVGYEYNRLIIMNINNNQGRDLAVVENEWKSRAETDNSKRNIAIKIPIDTQKCDLEINLTQLNDDRVEINDAEFELLQPISKKKYISTTGTTTVRDDGKNGVLIFKVPVMPQAGPYTYYLHQNTTQPGFIIKAQAITIQVEFDDNGNIINQPIIVEDNHQNITTGEWQGDRHILIKAQNEAETDDTFNVEINLKDQDTGSNIDGAVYQLELTKPDGTSLRKFSEPTVNGKVNVELPGSGNLQLRITQIDGKANYNIDTDTKIISFKRLNGEVQDNVDYARNEKSGTRVEARGYHNENKLVVNLTNKIKTERNIVEVHLTEAEETDIGIKNIELKLKNTTNGREYSGITNQKGIVTFQIDNEEAGVPYNYTISTVTPLPNIYNRMDDAKLILDFNTDKYITMAQDGWDSTSTGTNPLYEFKTTPDLTNVETVDNDGYLDHKTTLKLGVTIDKSNAYSFEVHLKDEEDNTPIPGASYDIVIKDIDGNEIRRKEGAVTSNPEGKISTYLPVQNQIIIEVTEKNSAKRYRIDSATKEILLSYNKNSGTITIDPSSTNVELNGQKVIYNHTNMKKSGDDVLLDLTISKIDKNLQNTTGYGMVSGVPIRVWQEESDLKGIDDPISTKEKKISMVVGTTDASGLRNGTWIEKAGKITNPEPVTTAGIVDIRTETDSVGETVIKGLKVENCEFDPGWEGYYYIHIAEVNTNTGEIKPNTEVKLEIKFIYDSASEGIRAVSVVPIWGYEICEEPVYGTSETNQGYQTSIAAKIFANFDDVGNLQLDFNKTNKDGEKLVGARYDVTVLRPDGITSKLGKDITDDCEFAGIPVIKDTIIQLNETDQVPNGYAKNEDTIELVVGEVDKSTGEVKELNITNSKNINGQDTIKITSRETQIKAGGTSLKTIYNIDLIDYEQDTFNMKIIAKDSKTQEPIPGYSFEVVSSKGSTKITDNTNENGEVETLVGGNYKNDTVTYTITKANNAIFYKDSTPFTVTVPFDADGKIDTIVPNNIFDMQTTDPNYGELASGKKWKIKQVNVLYGSDIELEVYIDTEDPLNVEVETIDKVSGNRIGTVEYKITPSKNLPGESVLDPSKISKIEVGYVAKGQGMQYTLKTILPERDGITPEKNEYVEVPDQEFIVNYDANGNIATGGNLDPHFTTTTTSTITKTGNQTIRITNYVEPKQGIQLVNKNYFTGNNIPNAEFEITTEEGDTLTASLGALGQTEVFGSKYGDSSKTEVRYKIKQTKRAEGYASIPEEFEIVVTYNSNREITNVSLGDNKFSKWIKPDKIIPGTSTDLGYNGNNKGIVVLEINSYYDFRINIENVDRLNNDVKVGDTQYNVNSTMNASNGATTLANGIAEIHLDELKSYTGEKTVAYTIKETAPSPDYQALEVNEIIVTVDFDADGYVKIDPTTGKPSVTLTSPDPTTIITAEGINPVSDVDKFTINVQISSIPKLRINIQNNDNWDGHHLPGTKYKITSDVGYNSIEIDNNKETIDGNIQLRVEGSTISKSEVVYTIQEETPSVGYQTIEQDVKIRVKYNPDGTIKEATLEQGKFTSNPILPNPISSTLDSLTLNIEIRSVKLLDFVIQSEYWEKHVIDDSEPSEYIADNGTVYEKGSLVGTENFVKDGKMWRIRRYDDGKLYRESAVNSGIGYKFKISAIEVSSNSNLDIDKEGSTDTNGQTIINMDKALSNKTIRYTITEKAKPVGCEWLEPKDIVVEVQFDSEGKIVNTSTIQPKIITTEATEFSRIVNVVVDNHEIYLEIVSTLNAEFGVKITAKNIYDSEELIDGVQANAYLIKDSGVGFTKDEKYEIQQADTSSMDTSKKYVTVPADTYTDEEIQDKNEKYLADAKYLTTGVDRDNNGDPDVGNGQDYLKIGRYLEKAGTRILKIDIKNVPDPYQYYNNYSVDTSKKSSNMNINDTTTKQVFNVYVRVNFDDEGYLIGEPSLLDNNTYNQQPNVKYGYIADARYVKVTYEGNAISVTLNFYPMLYTKLEAVDMYTKDALDSKLMMSTSKKEPGPTPRKMKIQEGWIGYVTGITEPGKVYTMQNFKNKPEEYYHQYIKTAKAGSSKSEMKETKRTFYIFERGEPRRSEHYYQKYVRRDETGILISDRRIATIEVTYEENGMIKDAEVKEHRSSNNIKENYIKLDWNGYYLSVQVLYAPTTKIQATVVDRVTEAPIGNVSLTPFLEGNIRYEIKNENYERTDASGKADWTYWRGNIPEKDNTYKIGTQFIDNRYNGYFLPGDVELKVTYNENGRIGYVDVLSQNQFKDAPNAEATWSDTTINLVIKLDRKFNLKIDKLDIYDSTEELEYMTFEIKSNKNENVDNVQAFKTTTIGRIHPGTVGKPVEYTLSETTTYSDYVPLKNLKMYVEFNDDGTVERAYVDPSNEKYFSVVAKSDVATGINGINTTDLEIIVNNEPSLWVEAEVTDEFYGNLKLEGATFTLENDKGQTNSGSIITDANGKFSTSIGPIHPNEDVTYTLRQTSKVNGYEDHTGILMEFQVHYNENGKIESYKVTRGQERFNIEPEIYKGTKYLKLDITNRPVDVNIGIVNIDDTTGLGINDVEYKVTYSYTNRSYITANNADGDGTVSGKLDEFTRASSQRTVRYTISEINIPNTYRKIQDVVLDVTYNEDGSIKNHEVISNESNVDVQVFARGQNITKLNNLPTHIKLTIRNDNRYDLIIKNKDANPDLSTLGIEGTIYEVLIDDNRIQLPATDTTGTTGEYKIDGVGEINIRVAEKTIGSGYKEDNTNNVQFKIIKGEHEYSLALGDDPGDVTFGNDKAKIEVDEEKGTITVTFYNETKLELDILKNDINTQEVLDNVVFEITQQEVDNRGNLIGTPKLITDRGVNDTTKDGGKLHFELGQTEPNKIIVYTIKETSVPENYNLIKDIKITAKFDTYGQLEETLEDDSYRAEVIVNPDNKNGIQAIIGNGVVEPGYKITIQSIDSITGQSIYGSKFDIDVLKDDVGQTPIEQKHDAITGDILVSGRNIRTGAIMLSEKEEGNIIIDVNQNGLAPGYDYSNNTSGIIKAEITYEAHGEDLEADVHINIKEDGGLEVRKDDNNREIIIKVKNDPVIDLNIFKYNETTETTINEKGEKIVTNKINPMEGIKFTITSEIQEDSNTVATDLNQDLTLTNTEGKTSIKTINKTNSRTVNYKLKESQPDGYEEIGDIILSVRYNTDNSIKSVEALSDETITTILTDKNMTKEMKECFTEDEIKEISKSGEGTRQIYIAVKNIIKNNKQPYSIVLQKHKSTNGEYDKRVPDAQFDITVTEEFGDDGTKDKVTSWSGTTDENGEIKYKKLNGIGTITIEYVETIEPDGYEKTVIGSYKTIIHRELDGRFIGDTSTEGYEINEEENTIYLLPQNRLKNDRYDFVINKIDADNNKAIVEDSAIFDISIFEKQIIMKEVDSDSSEGDTSTGSDTTTGTDTSTEEDDGTEEDDETEEEIKYETEEKEIEVQLARIQTDAQGQAKTIEPLQMVTQEGTYKMRILEVKTPHGYITNPEGYFLNVTFKRNSAGEMEIEDITPFDEESAKNLDILKSRDKQLIYVNVKNKRETEGLLDNEFEFNIKKVDSATGDAILDKEAVFKFTDDQGAYSYVELDTQYGEIKTPYIVMPAESEFVNDDGTPKDTIEKNYELVEISSPEGYLLNTTPINITVTFTKNSDNKIIIQSTTVTRGDENIEATENERTISFNVSNEEGTLVDNVERGRYTINLLKVDGKTGDPITGKVTFVLTLENGQKVTASTDENGNIKIEDIKVPSTVVKDLGPYHYTIEETKPADGYELLTGIINMDITFKELDDPTTGVPSGLYGIDTATLTTAPTSATIESYTEKEVNLKVENTLGIHTIKYDANCDDTTIEVPADQIKTPGVDLTLDSMIPEREGYAFIGWTTKADVTEAEYQPGDKFTIDKSTTLYAIWEEKLWITSEEYCILNATIEKKGEFWYVTYDNEKIFEYNDGDKYITKILPKIYYAGSLTDKNIIGGTYLEDFMNNIKTNADKVIITKKQVNAGEVIDLELKENELIGTGMTVEFIKGKQNVKLKIVVPGDVIGMGINMKKESADGRWTPTDYSLIVPNSATLGDEILKHGEDNEDSKDISYALAMDINIDGKIQPSDLTVFKNHFNKNNKTILDLKSLWTKILHH